VSVSDRRWPQRADTRTRKWLILLVARTTRYRLRLSLRGDCYALPQVEAVLPADEVRSPLIGHLRYVAVNPVRLAPGEYVIGSEAFELDPDYYVYSAAHTAAEAV